MAFQGLESKVAFVEIHRPQVLKAREKEMPMSSPIKETKK